MRIFLFKWCSYVSKKEKKPKKFAFYLTYKYINQLQNYYGIAIRSDANTSVSDMRKAVGAVLYHCSDANNLEIRHQFCPLSSTSWCIYKMDQVNGTNKYVEKPGLPIPLRKRLEPIFRELSTPELLKMSAWKHTGGNLLKKSQISKSKHGMKEIFTHLVNTCK